MDCNVDIPQGFGSKSDCWKEVHAEHLLDTTRPLDMQCISEVRKLVCLSVCPLSVCLSVCLFVFTYVCLSAFLSFRPCVYTSFRPYVCLFYCLIVFLSSYPSLSDCQFISLFTQLLHTFYHYQSQRYSINYPIYQRTPAVAHCMSSMCTM